jgi:hypothetical protein
MIWGSLTVIRSKNPYKLKCRFYVMELCNLILIAWLVGFFGDLAVQLANKWGIIGFSGNGLTTYFRIHGRAESAFIAAGIIAGFYAIWIGLGLPLRWELILLVALILDLIWNYANVFPSLKEYYKEPYIPRTILGVVIPFLLPLFIYARSAVPHG